MPVVRINDATFADLSALKVWFGTKTPAETIDRIVREAMEQNCMERDDEPELAATTTSNSMIELDIVQNLTHTKPLKASINGQLIPKPSWSGILVKMIEQLKERGFYGDSLVRELAIPAKAERYEEDGFTYHPNLGISVQGQPALSAGKEIDRLAKQCQIPLRVEFRWRKKEGARFPGKTGILRSGGV